MKLLCLDRGGQPSNIEKQKKSNDFLLSPFSQKKNDSKKYLVPCFFFLSYFSLFGESKWPLKKITKNKDLFMKKRRKGKNIYHTLQTQLRMCGGQKQGHTIYQKFTQLDVKTLIFQPKDDGG